jgi:hypothetical protein
MPIRTLVDVATMTAEPLAQVRPWVKPEEMAEMSAFHIAASDGFRIHGYVPRSLVYCALIGSRRRVITCRSVSA